MLNKLPALFCPSLILGPGFILCVAIILCGCKPSAPEQASNTLTVVTRNGLTTYYEDKNGPTGFEYELVKRFATSQNLKLKIITVHSLEDLFETLANNSADLAAASLTITDKRRQQWLFSPAYFDVKQYLLFNRKTHTKPTSFNDISQAKITIMAGSSHSEILNTLSHSVDNLIWHEAPDAETIDLLDMLENGEIDYSIIDSNDFIANKGFYPQLDIAFELGKPGELAWALPNTDKSLVLLKSLASFFKRMQEDGSLQQLQERFYSHAEEQEQISTKTFADAIKEKLPQYQDLIEKVALQHDIDWRLLASISYQESHWNPRARSPTGVRGMMMLTQRTAKEVNVSNRLDPEQSLAGGARYYKKIKAKIARDVKEPDRTWFALAAYNLGLGHVKDIRKLTKQQGADPNKWADIKTRLPLLQKRHWYKDTKYGYARGQEALTYVQNIRHYYNYLEWSELSENRTPPPKNMNQYLPDSLQSDFDAL